MHWRHLLVVVASVVGLASSLIHGAAAPTTTRPPVTLARVDVSAAALVFGRSVSARAQAAVSVILPSQWEQVRPHHPLDTVVLPPAPARPPVVVAVRTNTALPHEAFTIRSHAVPDGTGPTKVVLTASSDRGLILGAGRLLRMLHRPHSTSTSTSASATVYIDMHLQQREGLRREHPLLDISVAPPPGQIRGVQFTTAGVGPNSTQAGQFASWTNAEQYVKELAVFGGNTVELAHLFTGVPSENACLRNYSILLDKFDMNVHLWLPVDNTVVPMTPTLLLQYADLFANMTRVDALHVPGGDGGPGYFSETWFNAVRDVAAVLRTHHPKARQSQILTSRPFLSKWLASKIWI